MGDLISKPMPAISRRGQPALRDGNWRRAGATFIEEALGCEFADWFAAATNIFSPPEP
jgi:hypothetical protein